MKKMMMSLAVAGFCGAGVVMAEEAAVAPAAEAAAPVALPMMVPEAPEVKAFSWDNVPAVVAKVGAKDITRDDLKAFVLKSIDGGEIPAQAPAEQVMMMLYLSANQMVRAQLMQGALQSEKMPEISVLVEETLKKELAKASKEDVDKLTEDLKQQGKTIDDMVKEMSANPMVQSQVAFMALGEKLVAGQPAITAEEAKKSYEENIANFTTPATVQVAHILLKDSPDEKADADAKAKIEEILVQVRANPDSFAEMAKTNSICPSSAEGGDLQMPLDENTRGIDETFLAASLPLKEGEISDVVKTQFGYHIIKCLKRTDGSVEAFTPELEKQIIEMLTAQRAAKAAQEFMKKYEAENKTEVFLAAPQMPPMMMQ